jgi:hypothetical protein
MKILRLLLCLGPLAGGGSGVRGAEREFNLWPLRVERSDAAGRLEVAGLGGPLVFEQRRADGGTTSGLRPFWAQTVDAKGALRSASLLYPLFSYSADEEHYTWSVFQLVNRSGRRADAPPRTSELGPQETFDVWPFWFSRTSGAPELRYRGLFPLAGTVRGHLGYERIAWTLFPFFTETEKHGAITRGTPWPFVRTTTGAAQGFALWPLVGRLERPGVARDEFWLWPLAYRSERAPAPDAPAGTPPTRRFGVLPFYARAEGPGFRGEDFLWPFFGHTERTSPQPYQEKRFFWPLLVQGRGPDHYVNRWAPLYTHSVIKGYDKTWLAWPLWREAQWTADGVAQTKSQLLWFLYWSHEQRSLARPDAAPASLRHVWPLFSAWDNGAGRRQWQALSPFGVFFPHAEKVNESWSPLFAVVRHDQRAPGDARTSLLWDAITWERRAPERTTEFHLGPLLAVTTQPAEQRVALGRGLLGMKRAPGERAWRLFWLDFPAKPATSAADRP